ncbi:MAG: ROK family transcriptional regulator [Mobiluncus porci]|uniref:ROK family transcriptional regulator n=1 Tax=Mobiluncus porci TaxID=2652278 RepID=UPI0023F19991|nr:ROK family transcriptional regulator [Mobiluncus porci]MDD7541373.1 ROK family transcriptional regulator [Mobiluncus porci]MDY5747856.1 ROK family transcriptional regulator [Mobiluncus porci]
MFTGLTSSKERVLAQIIHDGPLYRADLARVLGVSRTTITNATQALVLAGLLAEEKPHGLKAKLYVPQSVGVMVSVTFTIRSTAVFISTLDGAVVSSQVYATEPSELGIKRFETAEVVLCDVLGDVGNPPIAAMHIAVNTQVDTQSGEVLGGEASRMWQGVNLLKGFSRLAPQASIIIENTARLIGLMQAQSYSCERRNLAYVHVSFGVTLGHILDGHIVHGSRGGAGELGHVSIDPHGLPCECGNRGCLMQYIGEEAVMERARVLSSAPGSVDELVGNSSKSDAAFYDHGAVALLDDLGECLGRALVTVCHILDPDVIVIGGKLAFSDIFVDAVKRVVLQRALPLTTSNLEISAVHVPFDVRSIAEAGIDVLRRRDDIIRRCVELISSNYEL